MSKVEWFGSNYGDDFELVFTVYKEGLVSKPGGRFLLANGKESCPTETASLLGAYKFARCVKWDDSGEMVCLEEIPVRED